MSRIHIIPSEFNKELELQLAYSIKAGFPSPAEDYQHKTLDFNRDLIKHPEATFYGRVDGDSMIDAGILRVEKHDDRLCFRNPGLLRLPIDQIYEGGVSYARNPKIQNMLRMVGYGENLGSGFPLILDAWKQAGWGTPMLNNKLELDMVELVLPLSAISENKTNTTIISPSTENEDGEKSREKSREKIINIIRNNPSVTQFELSTILQISTKAIEKQIKKLKEDGIYAVWDQTTVVIGRFSMTRTNPNKSMCNTRG